MEMLANRKDLWGQVFLGYEMAIGLLSCLYSKLILKKSQIKGAQRPKVWVYSEPLGFIKAVRDESRVWAGLCQTEVLGGLSVSPKRLQQEV